MISKVFINTRLTIHFVENDFLLNCWGRVLLLYGNCKTLQEGFIKDLGRDEFPVIRATALRVCSRDDSKTASRSNGIACFLVEVGLTLTDRLETHQLVRATINFIKNENR